MKLFTVFILMFCLSGFSYALTPEDFNPIRKDLAEIKKSLGELNTKVDKLSEKIDKQGSVVKSTPTPDCACQNCNCTDCKCEKPKSVVVQPVPLPAAVTSEPKIVGYRYERQCDGERCWSVKVPVYEQAPVSSQPVLPATYSVPTPSYYGSGSCSSGSCGSSNNSGFSNFRPFGGFFRGSSCR